MKSFLVVYLCTLLLLIIPFISGASLYVNQSNPSCNGTADRAHVANGSMQWCNLYYPFTNDLVLSGDTVYIARGEFIRQTNSDDFEMTNWNVDSDIIVTSVPGNQVNISVFKGNYTYGSANGSNQLWANKTGGTWIYKDNGTTGLGLGAYGTNYPIVFFSNHTHMFTTDNIADFNSCPYSSCSYFNTTSHNLSIHFNDTSRNPNNERLMVSAYSQPLLVQACNNASSAKIVFENLTFKYYGYIELYNSSGVRFSNNNFLGFYLGIYVRGFDDHESGDVTINNNYFFEWQDHSWDIDDIKGNREEGAGIKASDVEGPLYIYNNTFNYTSSGVLLYNTEATECNGSRIYNNTFINGYGSQLEIENFAYLTNYYDNKIYDCYYSGVSFAPANCLASPQPCQFYNNLIFCNGSYIQTGSSVGAYAVKAESRVSAANNASNWNITHNTFVGKLRSLNDLGNDSSAGGTTKSTFTDTNWTNNLFFSYGDYTLVRGGLAVNRVLYNYNLYYLEPSGSTALFGRWNNDTSGLNYDTLAEALAGPDWDGTWDINSIEGDPLFLSTSSSNSNFLVPNSTSPACGAASGGTDIGALPCAEEEEEEDPVDDSPPSLGGGLVFGLRELVNGSDPWYVRIGLYIQNNFLISFLFIIIFLLIIARSDDRYVKVRRF